MLEFLIRHYKDALYYKPIITLYPQNDIRIFPNMEFLAANVAYSKNVAVTIQYDVGTVILS